MKLICIMPVRNEDWVLGLSARAALMWCDGIVMLDHRSTDRTRSICHALAERMPDKVTLMTDSSVEWEEMRHRQALLDRAREEGATHIALVDADEVLTGNLLPVIRGMVAMTPAGSVLQLPWLCLRDEINRYHSAGLWAEQEVSVSFANLPAWHWTAAADGYDFHHRHPMGRPLNVFRPSKNRGGGLMHLQFVNERRLRAKQFLYQLTERRRWPDREPAELVRRRYSYAIYGQDSPTARPHDLAPVPLEWWQPYLHLLHHLKPGAEPWQERECRRLVAAEPQLVTGLDTFGVV